MAPWYMFLCWAEDDFTEGTCFQIFVRLRHVLSMFCHLAFRKFHLGFLLLEFCMSAVMRIVRRWIWGMTSKIPLVVGSRLLFSYLKTKTRSVIFFVPSGRFECAFVFWIVDECKVTIIGPFTGIVTWSITFAVTPVRMVAFKVSHYNAGIVNLVFRRRKPLLVRRFVDVGYCRVTESDSWP